MGSASTSTLRRCVGAVGTRSASTPAISASACRVSAARRYIAWNVSGGREAPGTKNDLAHDRMHRLRAAGGHVLDRRVALGHPRAVVQQRRDLIEDAEVDRHT